MPSVSGEYRVDDLFRSHPKFAVINMEENKSAVNLAKNLLESGYKDVRFYDDLCQHPVVQERIGMQKTMGNNQGMVRNLQNNSQPMMQNHGNSGVQVQITKTVPFDPFSLSSTAVSSSPASTSSPFSSDPQTPLTDQNSLVNQLLAASAPSSTPPIFPPMQRKKEEPLEEEVVKCRLCDAEIMITRSSCLQNHVKKHCDVKMFQCTECTFASNVGIKVTCHMKQQHALVNTYPRSRTLEQIQPILDRLMTECFPNHNKPQIREMSKLAKNGEYGRRRGTTNQWYSMDFNGAAVGQPQLQRHQPAIPINLVHYHCIECRLPVRCVLGSELMADGPLVGHLRTTHTLQCMPWRCLACGYTNTEQWKVRRHICVRHPGDAHQINVGQSRKPEWAMFLTKFFSDFSTSMLEDREDVYAEQLDKNPQFWNYIATTPPLKRPPPPEEVVAAAASKRSRRTQMNPTRIVPVIELD